VRYVRRFKRAIILGYDSLHARLLNELVKKGHLPNFKKIMNEGYYAEVVPVMPAQTPSGWATIATGAAPATHGIFGFFIKLSKDPLEVLWRRERDGFDSRYCRAETLWEVAERSGKKVILVKYPGTWPPVVKRGIQIDGHAGYAGRICRFTIAPPQCFATKEALEHLEAEGEAVDVQVIKLERATWSKLPKSRVRPLEAELQIKGVRGDVVKKYYILIYGEEGYEELCICRERDYDTCIARLREGAWSDWIVDEYMTKDELLKGATKFKLIYLSKDGRRLRLYMHQVHAVHGFTVPDQLAGELLKEVGPYFEYTGPMPLWKGWIDLKTQLEIYEQHTEWMIKTIHYLARKYPWDIMALQWHPLDYILHIVWAAIDENHPFHEARKKDVAFKALVETFKLADKLLGEVLELVDDQTLLAVIGDHGHMMFHSFFSINNWLMRKGYLKVRRSERGLEVEWSKTKAIALESNYIYINLKGRDPEGIVEPSEYDELREKIIKELYEVKDPMTGHCPILFAIRREDARSLGLDDEAIGDIVYCMREGYQTFITPILPEEPLAQAIFKRIEPFREHTSEHTGFYLSSELNTVMILYGKGIKPRKRRSPVRLLDFAPTIAYLLGLPLPRHAEGAALLDVIEDT